MKIVENYYKRKLDMGRIRKYLDYAKNSVKCSTGDAQVPNLSHIHSNFGMGHSSKMDHDSPNSHKLQVSCVQRAIRPVRSIESYADMLAGFVAAAAKAGSQLVVFPEYNFFDLFGLMPGFNIINNHLNKKAKAALFTTLQKDPAADPDNVSATDSDSISAADSDSVSDSVPKILYTLFDAISGPVQNAIETIFCHLARQYFITIYTGSYMIKDGERIYNAGSLISPDGKIVGTQKKIHLTDFEDSLGLGREHQLHAYSLDIGKVACPICMDATYYETFHIARALGCDIVILPIANNEEYNMYKALRGIWPRVQESHVYGLKASLNGWIAGMHFTGKAGIFAPIHLTQNQDGIIAMAEHHEGDFLVTGLLDLEQLYKERESAEYYGDVNEEFERNYYLKTYKQNTNMYANIYANINTSKTKNN